MRERHDDDDGGDRRVFIVALNYYFLRVNSVSFDSFCNIDCWHFVIFMSEDCL